MNNTCKTAFRGLARLVRSRGCEARSLPEVWVGTRSGGVMSAFKCILCAEMSVSLYVSWVM